MKKVKIIPNAKDALGQVINTTAIFDVKSENGSYCIITNGYRTLAIHKRYLEEYKEEHHNGSNNTSN